MRLELSVQSLLSYFEQTQCSQFLPAQLRTAIKFPFQLKIYLVADSGEQMFSFFLHCSWVLMTNDAEPSGLLCLPDSCFSFLIRAETLGHIIFFKASAQVDGVTVLFLFLNSETLTEQIV